MPKGDKAAYTEKQKRQVQHIEDNYEERGVDEKKAEEIAWATVNKQDGGGKLSGSGRAVSCKSAANKVKKQTEEQRSVDARSASAKKAAVTRKQNAVAKKSTKGTS